MFLSSRPDLRRPWSVGCRRFRQCGRREHVAHDFECLGVGHAAPLALVVHPRVEPSHWRSGTAAGRPARGSAAATRGGSRCHHSGGGPWGRQRGAGPMHRRRNHYAAAATSFAPCRRVVANPKKVPEKPCVMANVTGKASNYEGAQSNWLSLSTDVMRSKFVVNQLLDRKPGDVPETASRGVLVGGQLARTGGKPNRCVIDAVGFHQYCAAVQDVTVAMRRGGVTTAGGQKG